MKEPKILVTGSMGALGKTLVRRLKQENYEYLGTVNENYEKKSQFHVRKCDITIFDSGTSVINDYKPSVIIHLAGLTGNLECESEPQKAFTSNVLGTYNILKAAMKTRTKIIFASSREVYGNTKTKANEDYPLRPNNVNGTTKMLSEHLILNFAYNYHIPYVILRFTNFFGENNERRGISSMIKNAIEGKKIYIFGGRQQLDLLYYEDAVSAIMKSIHFDNSDVFNIGSGSSITPLLLLKKLEKIYRRKVEYETRPYRDFEVRRFSINIEKSHKILGFCPSHNIDMVLEKMVKKWS